jgi:hypothetical protein
LSFGATDLAGPIVRVTRRGPSAPPADASRRGLPLADQDDAKKLVKRREIAGFVERAGFRPVFVTTDARANRSGAEADVSTRPHADT